MLALTNSLEGKPEDFKLTSEVFYAIKRPKNKLVQSSTLVYLNFNSPFAYIPDASDKAVGIVLNQPMKNVWPSTTFSKRLVPV